MPVPFVWKLGFKIVINPKLCQQLGIYSNIESKEINDLFHKFLESNYIVWYYAFNDCNTFSESLKLRQNFLIFPDRYETVRQKYSPKRKRKLRLDQEVIDHSEMIKNPDLDLVKHFIKKTGLGAGESDLQDFIALLTDFYHHDQLDFYGFFYHKKLINLIAIYREPYTLTLLGTYNERDFVKLSGSSYLIDQVISENIEEKIFDFEGSEIPAVEEFFRGFRPESRPYPCLQKSKKEVVKEMIKTIFFLK